MRKWLSHAFHIDPPGPAEPTPPEQAPVDWVCLQIARRRLTTPGLIVLEMSRPLNWIGAQAMHFMQPGAWALLNDRRFTGYKSFASFLERRGSMEYLCRRVEHFEEELARLEREGGDIRAYIAAHLEAARAQAAADAAADDEPAGHEAREHR